MQPTPDPSRDLLSVGEFADEMHVTARVVRRLIADGELPAPRVGHASCWSGAATSGTSCTRSPEDARRGSYSVVRAEGAS
ncbi:MAG: hypothetical protein HGA44_08705 [Cellulomonadaceae bacterium]|nr:hypothetical protein [Cellulomonadaceae bacterium]